MKMKAPAPDEVEAATMRRCISQLRRAADVPVTFGGFVDDRKLCLSQFDGTRTSALRGLVVRKGAGLGGRVVATARAGRVDDYPADGRISHDYDTPVSREGLRSVVAVPVIVDGMVAGVIYAGIRVPYSLGDRVIALALGTSAEVAKEIAVGREVRRRLAAATESASTAADRLAGGPLEQVREAHAELRVLASTVTDPSLRARLHDVGRLLADVTTGTAPPPRAARLTAREVDVLAQVALGCSNAEAGERLGLLPETVKGYLHSASCKLEAHGRLAAVVAARRAGFLP